MLSIIVAGVFPSDLNNESVYSSDSEIKMDFGLWKVRMNSMRSHNLRTRVTAVDLC